MIYEIYLIHWQHFTTVTNFITSQKEDKEGKSYHRFSLQPQLYTVQLLMIRHQNASRMLSRVFQNCTANIRIRIYKNATKTWQNRPYHKTHRCPLCTPILYPSCYNTASFIFSRRFYLRITLNRDSRQWLSTPVLIQIRIPSQEGTSKPVK